MSGIELLRKLINVVSPSGDEELVRGLIKKEMQKYVSRIETDNLRNLI